MSNKLIFTEKGHVLWEVPNDIKNVKITAIGGGGVTHVDVIHNDHQGDHTIYTTYGAGQVYSKTYDLIKKGICINIAGGQPGESSEEYHNDGEFKYSYGWGGNTEIIILPEGKRTVPIFYNTSNNDKNTIIGKGAGKGTEWPDRLSFQNLVDGINNGTPYGGSGRLQPDDRNNIGVDRPGQWGAAIIEYDDATAQPPVDPTPPQPPSPGHTSIDWTFPDLSNDPRFILSRFTRIIDIAEQIATNCLAIGDIYNNPVISIGGRYNLPIPDSMKVSRHRHDSQCHADTLPTRAQWAASAEKPLSVNNINAMINTFNSFNNSVSGYCPDILATGGTDLIDTISPDQVATFHFFYQVRDKFARWEAYINNHMGWWDGNDLCARSCQVTCQTACQAACQGCNNSTCHNQNCGGWS